MVVWKLYGGPHTEPLTPMGAVNPEQTKCIKHSDLTTGQTACRWSERPVCVCVCKQPVLFTLRHFLQEWTWCRALLWINIQIYNGQICFRVGDPKNPQWCSRQEKFCWLIRRQFPKSRIIKKPVFFFFVFKLHSGF